MVTLKKMLEGKAPLEEIHACIAVSLSKLSECQRTFRLNTFYLSTVARAE